MRKCANGWISALAITAMILVGCSDYRDSGGSKSTSGRTEVEDRSDVAMREFKTRDPSLNRFFQTAVGYAVFPRVGKGGVGVGGAHGNGTVYERGVLVGFSELTQGSVGFQLGGQVFSEIIFFENQAALDHFKQGNSEFSAQASAVAAAEGAAASADYHQGVAVFVMPQGGLMFEASIGGQKFTYVPVAASNMNNPANMNSANNL